MRANAFECASCPLSRPAACYVLPDALCLRHLNLRWPRYQYPALWFINWAPTRPSHGLYALPNDTINSRVGRAAFSMRRLACAPITNHAWILTACAPTDAAALFCIQITCNPLCPFCRGRTRPRLRNTQLISAAPVLKLPGRSQLIAFQLITLPDLFFWRCS